MQNYALLSLPWTGDASTETDSFVSSKETPETDEYSDELLQEPWLYSDGPSYSAIKQSFLPVDNSLSNLSNVESWLLAQESDSTLAYDMAPRTRLGSPSQYKVAWIAALPHERTAATAMLDEHHEPPVAFEKVSHDDKLYTWGKIGRHNVVIVMPPAGEYGPAIAAATAKSLVFALPHIRFGLMVGVGAGVPQLERGQDVRLGDVVVNQPHESSGGVVQYNLATIRQEGQFSTGCLAMPPEVLRKALAKLQAEHRLRDSVVPSLLAAMLQEYPKMAKRTLRDPGYMYPGVESDRLFAATSQHFGGGDCSGCPQADEIPRDQRVTTDPEIHYGIIASGETLMKSAVEREEVLQRMPESARSKCLCIETAAAGLKNAFPCIVIRGICDYADSHKNNRWQKYAAATAAAFAKELLGSLDAEEVKRQPELYKVVEQGLLP
jgi:nucleoside phosphorylase